MCEKDIIRSTAQFEIKKENEKYLFKVYSHSWPKFEKETNVHNTFQHVKNIEFQIAT